MITCRLGSAAGRLIGVYPSVADASDDLLTDAATIEDALSEGLSQTADTPNFWSRETVLTVDPSSPTASGSVPSAFLTHSAEFNSLASPLPARQRDGRGGHFHPESSTPVVALRRDTYALVARYRSIYEAMAATGACNISRCCRREAKTSGGLAWMYASDYDNLQKQ